MNSLAFKVIRKSGDYVKPSLQPAHSSAQARLGLIDAALAGAFTLCVGGLILLLLQL